MISPKIRVLLLTDVFKFMAGSEKNIVHLLSRTDRNRFDFVVACFVDGPLAKSMENEGYTIKKLEKGKFYSSIFLKNLMVLRTIIKEYGIGLIVTYHESSDFYGLFLSKICKVPVISNRRDMGFQTERKHEIGYRYLGRFFDLNIVVCRAVQEEMARRKWFPDEKIKCIYNGVDTNHFNMAPNGDKIKAQMGLLEGNLIVAVVANLRKVKGIRYFIEASAIISRKLKSIHFIIIGQEMNGGGCTREELERFAAELRVDDRIAFLGGRADVAELMKIIDVGVIPSLSEGFSNVILEFMACGKPVVATNVGGNREAVIHGENGFLVAPGNSGELAEGILRLLENDEMRKQLGAAAMTRVKKQFELQDMIEEYQKTFSDVIANRKG